LNWRIRLVQVQSELTAEMDVVVLVFKLPG
jgi:hypothetical protein